MFVKKAVFPVAGFGTRFLPATKVVAKEMLPVYNRPLIHYAVNEAIIAGCKELIFITNRYKHDIADYFDTSYELESRLEKSGKDELLQIVREIIPERVKVTFVTQSEPLGLGHAVLCAAHVIGPNPFYVILPDDFIWNGQLPSPTLSFLNDDDWEPGVDIARLATDTVPTIEASAYGVVNSRGGAVESIEEKPVEPKSNKVVVGRYLFSGDIFTYLERVSPGANGEIQLTDAIALAIASGRSVREVSIRGRRFDCGTPIGMFKAQTVVGLHHLGRPAMEFIDEISGN